MALFETDIVGPWAAPPDWSALADRAAAALGAIVPELANARLSASLLLTDDAEVRALNREWRDKDTATNVLSFPMLTRAELLALTPAGPPVLLGDIALAFETCAAEAADKAIAIEAHASHLIVHGLLHLAGHDHADDRAAEEMEALERKVLALLGLPDPYGTAA
jgi:probable rRNA maturation factor